MPTFSMNRTVSISPTIENPVSDSLIHQSAQPEKPEHSNRSLRWFTASGWPKLQSCAAVLILGLRLEK